MSQAETTQTGFPAGKKLEKLLELRTSGNISELLSSVLYEPIEDLFQRPRKEFRGQMVELGFALADGPGSHLKLTAEEKKLCACGAKILESLHAGSLVVDDIQDNSKVRRGKETLHLRYGLPMALNAGNWLYFWPMQIIREAGLSAEIELQLYQLCHRTLIRAHYGQALDVGIPVDTLPQKKIPSVCMASLELKSGALMALALTIGATLGKASAERIDALDEFGHRFGIALQMFDDLGNLKARPTKSPEALKQFEDLYLRRPSWVWVVAAENFPAPVFKAFLHAVQQLPDESYLAEWLKANPLRDIGKRKAKDFLMQSFRKLEEHFEMEPEFHAALKILKEQVERLIGAYE
ncbi:MAG: polyprenyl synthetase family protein [Bacteriovoracia bacterium]